ncbi:MAG: hypothetical protein KBB75_00565 [Candidatus Pacebacteria bacterium]|nr:hypothetical protein [Candidatus Paceibacterota bacterium]
MKTRHGQKDPWKIIPWKTLACIALPIKDSTICVMSKEEHQTLFWRTKNTGACLAESRN